MASLKKHRLFRNAHKVPLVAVGILTLGALSAVPSNAVPGYPADNGNSAIADSSCESALNGIAAKENFADDNQSKFICTGDLITIESTSVAGAPVTVIGSISSMQSRDVTGLSDPEIESSQQELGIQNSEATEIGAAAAEGPPNTCLPRHSTKSATKVDDYHARALISSCYGIFIARGGIAVEAVWSDWVSYTIHQNLTNRQNHTLSVTNTGTSPRDIDIEMDWNLRLNQTLGSDPIEDDGTFTFYGWPNRTMTMDEYTVPFDGKETYHITHDYVRISDTMTGEDFVQHINLKLPNFECPASLNKCSF